MFHVFRGMLKIKTKEIKVIKVVLEATLHETFVCNITLSAGGINFFVRFLWTMNCLKSIIARHLILSTQTVRVMVYSVLPRKFQ